MTEIKLTIQYRKGSTKQTFTIETLESSMDIDELSSKFAYLMAIKYSRYCNQPMDSTHIKRYRYGQQQLIRGYLEHHYGQR